MEEKFMFERGPLGRDWLILLQALKGSDIDGQKKNHMSSALRTKSLVWVIT